MILLFAFLSLWLGITFRYCWYALLLPIVVLIAIIFLRHSKKLAGVCLLIFSLGVGLSYIRISAPKEGTYEGIVYEAKDNYYLFSSKGERFYIYEKNNNREVGDILNIKGYKEKLSFTSLESSFDFKEYLNKKGVFNELTVTKVNVTFSSFLKIHALKRAFLNRFDKESQGIVSSILFSDSLSDEVVDSVRGLHLSKFLSANGTYIYVILMVLTYYLEKILSKKWSELVSFGIAQIYFLFVFPRFTIIRICFLYILRWINKYLLNKRFSYFDIISFSGIVFLLLDPYLGRQDSFVIGYLVPMVFYLARQVIKRRGKVQKTIIPLLIMYLFFLPFELNFYNSICPISPILQILLSPLFILIGLASLLCLIRIPAYTILSWLLDILKWSTSIFKYINIEIYAPPMKPMMLVMYYTIFILLLYYFEILFIPILKVGLSGYISLISLYFLPVNNLITKEVDFINVGQGDSCLIRDRNTCVLIDTGGLTYTDIAKETLIPFFKKKRIYDIDLVITTHDDFDHAGALSSLNKNFKIKNYIYSYENFPIKVGNLTFYNYNNHIFESDEENNKSLVIGFNLAKRDFLIMGDAPTSIEMKIMNEYESIPCDILKVGHHGSDTSSSYRFLEYLSPKEAVISCALNNKFGHPHQSVISNLKRLCIKIRRTDYSGTISYKSYIFNE